MTDETIFALISFVVAMIAVVTPIIKLNTNIVKLNTTLENFEEKYEENHKILADRVTAHGKQVDELDKKVATHEIRITSLEGKENKNAN